MADSKRSHRVSIDLLKPFRVRQLDTSSNGQSATGPVTGALSQFLLSNKENYLEAVKDGKATDWTVVMGNEAGDLDTIASSIAYSWLASTAHKTPTVALLQLDRDDIHLRPENEHALSLSLLDALHKDLLTLSDIPSSSRFPSTKFALVDHNRLLPRYSTDNPHATVVGVIDHHEDEGLYKDTADPRTIAVPTGSCSSLVTRLLQEVCSDQVPPDLATLLLCAILIDTDGLKIGGKAEQTDRDAADFLAPRSVLAPALPLQTSPATQPSGAPPPKLKLEKSPAVKALTKTLQSKKSSIEHLSTRDLLRRDYKEYSLTPSWAPASQINIGLSTVPLSLKSWVPKDPEFWASVDGWLDERGLAALGVLTSYHVKQLGAGMGKHRRQIFFIVKEQEGAAELEKRLWTGLEGSEVLKVEKREWSVKKYGAKATEIGKNRRARLYKQGNVKATRKAAAPLIKKIVEGEDTEGRENATAPTPDEQATK